MFKIVVRTTCSERLTAFLSQFISWGRVGTIVLVKDGQFSEVQRAVVEVLKHKGWKIVSVDGGGSFIEAFRRAFYVMIREGWDNVLFVDDDIMISEEILDKIEDIKGYDLVFCSKYRYDDGGILFDLHWDKYMSIDTCCMIFLKKVDDLFNIEELDNINNDMLWMLRRIIDKGLKVGWLRDCSIYSLMLETGRTFSKEYSWEFGEVMDRVAKESEYYVGNKIDIIK